MMSQSNFGGDGDQAETNPWKKEVTTLISEPGFLTELPKKLQECGTQINEEPKQENLKPCDLLEIDELILPKALTKSLMALEKNNKEFAETLQRTVEQCGQLKNSIDVLSLKVHKMVEREKLRSLSLSLIEDSRVTFSCVSEEESKCDHNEKTQLKDRYEEPALKVQNMGECEEPVQLLPPQMGQKESKCDHTKKKVRFEDSILKVQNMVECEEPVQLLSPQIDDSPATFIYMGQVQSICENTEKKVRFEESSLKVQNMVQCEKSLQLLPAQIDDSQATRTSLNEKESKCGQTEKKEQFQELSLEVHNKATRGELSHLPSSRIDASQATFSCIDRKENKCDQSTNAQVNDQLDEREELMELPPSLPNDSQTTFTCVEVEEPKMQLYNNLIKKFQSNAFDDSLENRPSKLIISKTFTKFRPPYSELSLSMAYMWDFSSSCNSLTEDVR